MGHLKVVGQHKGSVQLDVQTATVLDLKQAVSRSSGLAVAGLKLLAGGKHLKDDSAVLAQCGVTQGKTIMVLRQNRAPEMNAEEGLARRTENTARAASRLSARAARDTGVGGKENPWRHWGRATGSGRGNGVPLMGEARHDLPPIELTNQNGEAMTIPPEDSGALMEGMMLHRKALACLNRTGPSALVEAQLRRRTRQRPAAPSGGDVNAERFRHEEGGMGKACGAPVTSFQTDAAAGKDSAGAEGGVDGERAAEAHVGEHAEESMTSASGLNPPPAAATASQHLTPSPSPVPDNGNRHVNKRLAQREALDLLLRADDAFRRCNPVYLDAVDNYAYLSLDIVWLLFLMKDLSNLNLASRMLHTAEQGFLKAHGPGLQRLIALKGEHCAETLLYVRLHLLQGVVAFLQGDSGRASGLLIRASEEAKALRPDLRLAASLTRQWRAVKYEYLRPKEAFRALRAGRNSLDAAWQYLETSRQRESIIRKERAQRREQRRAARYGLTKDRRSVVNTALVHQLVDAGFNRTKAVRALRTSNNDAGTAIASLTSQRARSNDGAGGALSKGDKHCDQAESLAILQSLGVPHEAAREVLDRTGTLQDALEHLGLESSGERADSAADGGPKADGESGAEVLERNGSEDPARGGLMDDEEDELGSSGSEQQGPSVEELKLLDELAADGRDDDEEDYLDITLEDEADAADMYLHLCRGNIPLEFDLDKIRAGVAGSQGVGGQDSR